MVNPKLITYYRTHYASHDGRFNIGELVLKYKLLTNQLSWHLRQFERLFVQNKIDLSNYKVYKPSFEKNIVKLLRQIICARLDATIYLKYCDRGHWTYLKWLLVCLDKLERAHLTSPLVENTIHEMYESVVFRIRPLFPQKLRKTQNHQKENILKN